MLADDYCMHEIHKSTDRQTAEDQTTRCLDVLYVVHHLTKCFWFPKINANKFNFLALYIRLCYNGVQYHDFGVQLTAPGGEIRLPGSICILDLQAVFKEVNSKGSTSVMLANSMKRSGYLRKVSRPERVHANNTFCEQFRSIFFPLIFVMR